jgi:hypothetical protein
VEVIISAKVVERNSPLREVKADLSSMGITDSLPLKDDGVYPDQSPGDNRYSLLIPDTKNLQRGSYEIEVTVTDTEGRFTSSNIVFEVGAPPVDDDIVDSEMKGSKTISVEVFLFIMTAIVVIFVSVFLAVRYSKKEQDPEL